MDSPCLSTWISALSQCFFFFFFSLFYCCSEKEKNLLESWPPAPPFSPHLRTTEQSWSNSLQAEAFPTDGSSLFFCHSGRKRVITGKNWKDLQIKSAMLFSTCSGLITASFLLWQSRSLERALWIYKQLLSSFLSVRIAIFLWWTPLQWRSLLE